MKIRTRITFITILITILFVFISNSAFQSFFSSYLEDQEEDQVNYISHSVNSFFNDKKSQYKGSVNEWSHWDDTYDFINNKYPYYIEKHLTENTFKNLELNFAIIVDNDKKIKSKQFYDLDNKNFIESPEGFNKDIDKVIKYSVSNEDTSSILKLGNEFYFVATSQITDSKMRRESNGKIIFGRLIDESIKKDLEKITGSQVSFSIVNNLDYKNTSLDKLKFNRYRDTMGVRLIFKNIVDEDEYILVTLTKSRDLFVSGMNQVDKFMVFYACTMGLILFLVFNLMGRYISKPFTKLTDEVKSIDLTEIEIQRLKVYGKDEFAFLRNSINNMLSKIEIEQYNVRKNKERLHATLKSVGGGVIAVDKNGKIEFINDKAQRLTGYDKKEAYEKSFEDVYEVIDENTREKVESSMQKVFEIKKTVESDNDMILITKDGFEIVIEDIAAPIIDRLGKVIGVVLVFRDISEKKEKRKQIEFLSYHDQLTGAYNRRYFEEELIRLDNNKNLPLTIVYADVNGLKIINDAFGHKYGDLLIKQVSDVLKTEFRPEDIISRTGGDEFVILLPKTEGYFAAKLINNAKEKIEEKVVMNIKMSVSFGLATKNDESQSIENILKNAEDFMYKEKTFDSTSNRNAVIKSIINTLQIKNPREDAHSKRVGIICESIGKAYNLRDDKLKELRIAGELHDIGKIAIGEAILNKPNTLSKAEWTQIKRHPEIGYRLLCTSSEYYNIAECVLLHHERWDGKGYPKGLKAYQIPWKARVLAIADSYDAMTYDRPYRNSLSLEEAVEEIKKNAKTQFDPDIARTFVEKVLGLNW